MKVISVGLKGFKRENGVWSWTPEILCEYDPLSVELSASQIEDVQTALDSQRVALQRAVEGWARGGRA